MKYFSLFLAFFLLLSAKCSRNQTPAQDNTPFIQLETTPCFGFCPVYRLTVRNNGWVEYEGKRNAVKIGLDSFQLTAAELTTLRDKVKSVNLWQYPDNIPTQTADAPYGILTAWADGKTKSVNGTIDRPEPLLQLEEMLKDLAVAHGVDVRTGVNPDQLPLKKQEILIHFKPEVNAGNFMQQFSELNLQLVRRTGEQNIWIVAYDPGQIDAESLINLFKGMDGVVSAKRNE